MNHPASAYRPNRRGFTLIELLTVIAIIAVLAGLLMPVFASMRENARKGACMTNMKSIIQAIQVYKDDHRVYPDALYGISYNGVSLEPRLYPQYIKDERTFVCPNTPVKLSSPAQMVDAANPMTGALARLAAFSSYDFQYRTPTVLERHYTLKWTAANVTGLADDRRQLYYKEPPDNTVVTWCLYHCNMDKTTGQIPRNTVALVGFLTGRVQSIPAEKLDKWPGPDGNHPWQVSPKP